MKLAGVVVALGEPASNQFMPLATPVLERVNDRGEPLAVTDTV